MTDSNQITEVTASQAINEISKGAVIIDVREADEFVAGHIEGAITLPLSTITDTYNKIPTDQTIIVNCRSGARSARAVAFLRTVGIPAQNLTGGIIAWTQAGFTLVAEDGGTPRIA